MTAAQADDPILVRDESGIEMKKAPRRLLALDVWIREKEGEADQGIVHLPIMMIGIEDADRPLPSDEGLIPMREMREFEGMILALPLLGRRDVGRFLTIVVAKPPKIFANYI